MGASMVEQLFRAAPMQMFKRVAVELVPALTGQTQLQATEVPEALVYPAP